MLLTTDDADDLEDEMKILLMMSVTVIVVEVLMKIVATSW